VKVEWDEGKNLQNRNKHGIGFEQAQELFLSGAEYLEVFDEEHSEQEDRFFAVGPIRNGVVVIVWTERDEDTAGSSAHAGLPLMSGTCLSHTWTNTYE